MSSIITNADLEKIKKTISETCEKTDKHAEAKLKHEISKVRVQKWDNTLEGTRRKKVEEREKQLNADELARQKEDVNESKLQAKKRLEFFKKVNDQKFRDRIDVRDYEKHLAYSEALHERQVQMMITQELKNLDKVRDERNADMYQEECEKRNERDVREQQETLKKAKELQVLQREQLQKAIDARIDECERELNEGRVYQDEAKANLNREMEIAEIRRGKQKKLQDDLKKANAYLKQQKETEKKRVIAEELYVRDYAEERRRMDELRKARVKERFENKLKMKQAMVDRQAETLSKQLKDPETKLEHEIFEIRKMEEKLESQKIEHRKKQMEELIESRNLDIQRNRMVKQKEAEAEARDAGLQKAFFQQVEAREREELVEKRELMKQLEEEHKAEAEKRKKERKDEKMRERDNCVEAERRLREETEEFKKYAYEEIRNAKNKGRNIVPLLRGLQEYEKDI